MKKLTVSSCLLLFVLISTAQKTNWQNLDLQKDTVFGISTEKAYTEILSHKKKFKPVIVGVIDSGVDTAHEDLKSVIWINPKDNTYDGKDEDKDGYTDDVHGWDFIGGAHGDISKENLELVRMIRSGKGDSAMLAEYQAKHTGDVQTLASIDGFIKVLDSITFKIGKDTPTLADIQNFHPGNTAEANVKNRLISVLTKKDDYAAFRYDRIKGFRDYVGNEVDFYENFDFNPRPGIVGDDSTDVYQHSYGNADVFGPEALHGTHVSGIIGAVRNNGIGINGVADHVWIMSIRTVPDGDERDKDVANAIRYAADHGARVINMSFGKAYSPEKKAVDDAVRYAMSKDVLLIQAAGNDGKNIDHERNFPNRIYLDGTEAGAYLVVGAINSVSDSNLVASFSNYGKKSVDVFAPGVDIYSSVPGSKYTTESGTSMAAPVVTGLAALIREYYPKLTALQVKQIIIQSVVKPAYHVHVQDGSQTLSVPMSDISVSGGVVNVYQALQLAETF